MATKQACDIQTVPDPAWLASSVLKDLPHRLTTPALLQRLFTVHPAFSLPFPSPTASTVPATRLSKPCASQASPASKAPVNLVALAHSSYEKDNPNVSCAPRVPNRQCLGGRHCVTSVPLAASPSREAKPSALPVRAARSCLQPTLPRVWRALPTRWPATIAPPANASLEHMRSPLRLLLRLLLLRIRCWFANHVQRVRNAATQVSPSQVSKPIQATGACLTRQKPSLSMHARSCKPALVTRLIHAH